MTKEKIKTKLIRYRMKFDDYEKSLNIKMGHSHEILIEFSDDDKISMSDKLTSWNPLSGILNISLRKAVILQSVSIFLSWLLLLIIFSSLNLGIEYFEFVTMVLVGMLGFSILWSTYYLIKLESFKRTLMNWLDE